MFYKQVESLTWISLLSMWSDQEEQTQSLTKANNQSFDNINKWSLGEALKRTRRKICVSSEGVL